MRNPFQRKSDGGPAGILPDSYWDAIQNMGAMSMDSAVGLPAVLSIIRLLAHMSGMVDYRVVRNLGSRVVEDAEDTWQWRLLNRSPGPLPLTPFSMQADAAANFSGRGNAYLRKIKPATRRPGRPGILEFMPVSAQYVTPRRDELGQALYDDATFGRGGKPDTPQSLINIRSFSLGGPVNELRGVSPITACRTLIEAGRGRQEFEAAHLRNGIFPGFALKLPPNMKEAQGEQWVRFLEGRLTGTRKAGKIAAVGGGGELVPLPISLQDALFADMTHLTLEQAAGMWQVPHCFTMITRQNPTDADVRQLVTLALAPIAFATASAYNADPDMFGPDEQDLKVVPDFWRIFTADPLALAQAHTAMVQSGERLPDEIRATDGYGPLPPIPKDWTQHPGQIPQITPVGGAPNPLVGTGGASPAPVAEDDDEGEDDTTTVGSPRNGN